MKISGKTKTLALGPKTPPNSTNNNPRTYMLYNISAFDIINIIHDTHSDEQLTDISDVGSP